MNRTLAESLRRLGYGPEAAREILAWVEGHGAMEKAPRFARQHLAVFDCVFPAAPGSEE